MPNGRSEGQGILGFDKEGMFIEGKGWNDHGGSGKSV